MSGDAGLIQILGITVSAAMTVFAVFLAFELSDRRDRQKRRVVAYAYLNELLRRIEAKTQLRQARITEEQYDRLQEIIADNFDALRKSTVAAWNAKQIIRLVYGESSGPYEINFEPFCQEVRRQYQSLRSTT
jgi:hypothetical protein